MSEHCAFGGGSGGKPFELPGATEHYASDRPVRAEHVRIEVDLDFEKKAVSGTCSTRVVAVREVSTIAFDALDFEVSQVQLDGRKVPFTNTGAQVRLTLERPLAAGQLAEVAIHYQARPQKGLYFWGPDQGYPNRPTQAWTQGQDEDSRAWFPCLDAPAQKASTEVIATFPKGFTALSNGSLIEDRTEGSRRTMHYRFDFPHSPYLVTLAVGEFEEATAQHGETQLRYLFEKGRREDALRCVERTPKMIALFERVTGVKYPYGTYAQVFVTEFIFGGMENTSATTLTDTVLHDARAHLDYSAESLVSHELMHQWFGDLLTCRDWPHGWLNEGFATYGEVLWRHESEGIEEADQLRREKLDTYLDEAANHYARPIVARKFHLPLELFDRHLYEKGSLVLHELRRRLGDELFFKAIRHYVEAHVGRAVETVDLARAFEEATGHNLDRFFDQYVFAPGHPRLKAEVRYEAEEKRVRLKVTQLQEKEGGLIYRLPLDVCLVASTHEERRRLELVDREHVFFIPSPLEPTQFRIDPRREVLGTLEVDKSQSLWLAELEKAPEARARTEAALALGKEFSPRAIDALTRALGEDAFWGTQAACAKSLGALRTPEAKRALLDHLSVKHPKARRAVVAALGQFRKDEEVAKALRRLLEKGDPSYYVEGEAARSLGKLRLPDTVAALKPVVARPSFMDQIAVGAIDGMAETLAPEAWAEVEPLTRYGERPYVRRAAVVAAGKLAEPAEKKRETIALYAELLRDPQFRVQMAVFDGAQALGDRRLIPALESTPFRDGRCIRAARDTVSALREGEPQAKEVASLREEVDKLKEEIRSMNERLEWMNGGPGEKAKPPKRQRAPLQSARGERKRRRR